MKQLQARQVARSYFDSCYPFVRWYAWRMTGNPELAEDMAQVVFLRLYVELRKGKTIDNPKAWMLCVLRHEITKQAAKPARIARHEQLDILDRVPEGWVNQFEQAFEPYDLTKLCSVLTEREEEAILLRLTGLKYREIAKELGISPKTVSTLLTRALRKMRKAAKGDFEGDSVPADRGTNVSKSLQ